MSKFSERELAYLCSEERRLARIATVGQDGMPHVVPTGWSYNAELDTIDVGGSNLAATKKVRDIRRTGKVALVVDDVLPPWRPRCVEIRGRGEIVEQQGGLLIRIHPTRIVSWGLEPADNGVRTGG